MILLSGGEGLLAKELYSYGFNNNLFFKSMNRLNLDITRPEYWPMQELKPVTLIVHCAAFTDLVRAEKEKDLCYQTNVIGTRNVASLGIPMIYISTEYVFDGEKGSYAEEDYPNPINYYAFTKLLGEYEARRTKSVVIRCLFKPRPFKHDACCNDMLTSGDYVERIAPEIALAIKNFDKLPPILHIGTGKKKLIDLARETREVKEIKTSDVRGVRLPIDTSLNCNLWNKLKESFND